MSAYFFSVEEIVRRAYMWCEESCLVCDTIDWNLRQLSKEENQ